MPRVLDKYSVLASKAMTIRQYVINEYKQTTLVSLTAFIFTGSLSNENSGHV